MAELGPSFPRPERKVMWTILQLHYGNPDVHFELQPQMSRGQVELGLHLEGPVERNDLFATALAERSAELIGELGPAWELEEWTASWRRLHRVFLIENERLDRDLAREVSCDLAKAMRLLQPFAAACADGYEPPAPVVRPRHEGRHWRRSKPAGR